MFRLLSDALRRVAHRGDKVFQVTSPAQNKWCSGVEVSTVIQGYCREIWVLLLHLDAPAKESSSQKNQRCQPHWFVHRISLADIPLKQRYPFNLFRTQLHRIILYGILITMQASNETHKTTLHIHTPTIHHLSYT